jgi:hypothetical protein
VQHVLNLIGKDEYMGQKQIKKIRREQRKIFQEIEPILSQAVHELGGDRELLDQWVEMVLLFRPRESELPITEFLPSRMGFDVTPSIFMPDNRE